MKKSVRWFPIIYPCFVLALCCSMVYLIEFREYVDQDVKINADHTIDINTYYWRGTSIIYSNYNYDVPLQQAKAVKTQDSINAIRAVALLP